MYDILCQPSACQPHKLCKCDKHIHFIKFLNDQTSYKALQRKDAIINLKNYYT